MISKLLRPILETEIAEFEANGAVCLRAMFDPDWVNFTRDAIQHLLDTPMPIGPMHNESTARGGRLAVDTFVWWNHDAFRRYAFESPAAAIAARLLRSERVNLLYDQTFIKEPGTPVPTPWHQDGPYWPLYGDQACSLWMALDDVNEEAGAMKYARGSHHGPLYGFDLHHDPQRKGHIAEVCPDFEKEDAEKVLSWDVKAGDCLVHAMWTAHGSGANRSTTTRRRAHTTRWTGDSARYRVGKFRVPTPGPVTLEDGAALAEPYFPAVPFEKSWA